MCLQINMFSAIKLNVSMLCTFCWNNITCNNHVTHNNVVDFTISADIRLDYVVCSWAYLIPYGVFSPLSDRELSFFCFFGSLRETYADGGGGIPPLEPTLPFLLSLFSCTNKSFTFSLFFSIESCCMVSPPRISLWWAESNPCLSLYLVFLTIVIELRTTHNSFLGGLLSFVDQTKCS